MTMRDRAHTHVSELGPVYRFADEERPPIGVKIICLTRFGTAIISAWDKEAGFVAWCPLPALTQAKKARMEEIKSPWTKRTPGGCDTAEGN